MDSVDALSHWWQQTTHLIGSPLNQTTTIGSLAIISAVVQLSKWMCGLLGFCPIQLDKESFPDFAHLEHVYNSLSEPTRDTPDDKWLDLIQYLPSLVASFP